MQKIIQFVVGAGCLYGVWKFGDLTFTLLADGQFFTPILSAAFMIPCAIFAFIFLGEAVD